MAADKECTAWRWAHWSQDSCRGGVSLMRARAVEDRKQLPDALLIWPAAEAGVSLTSPISQLVRDGRPRYAGVRPHAARAALRPA